MQVISQDARYSIVKLNKYTAVAMLGKPSDKAYVSDLIKKEINLHRIKYGYDLRTKQILEMTQRKLRQAAQNDADFLTDMLVGAYDKDDGERVIN